MPGNPTPAKCDIVRGCPFCRSLTLDYYRRRCCNAGPPRIVQLTSSPARNVFKDEVKLSGLAKMHFSERMNNGICGRALGVEWIAIDCSAERQIRHPRPPCADATFAFLTTCGRVASGDRISD